MVKKALVEPRVKMEGRACEAANIFACDPSSEGAACDSPGRQPRDEPFDKTNKPQQGGIIMDDQHVDVGM